MAGNSDKEAVKRNRGNKIFLLISIFLVSFFAGLVLCNLMEYTLDKQTEATEEARSEYTAKSKINSIEIALRGYRDITMLWKASVIGNNGQVLKFEEISEILKQADSVISAIELAPDGVIEYVYPKDNAILGYDILNDERDGEDASEARDSGECVLSGPIDLKQGGVGVVLRTPVYIDEEFWGFSIIVLDMNSVLDRVSLDSLDEEGYVWQLWYENSDGEKVLISGTDGELGKAVEDSCTVGRRTWTLTVRPNKWYTEQSHPLHVFLSIVFSLVFGAVVFLIALLYKNNKELREAKSDVLVQTRALAASEKANRMQAKALEASQKANRMQMKALEASHRANKAQAESLDLAKRENARKTRKLEDSEAANQAKTEFISRISHDIRTPIGAIKNLTEFALMDMDDKVRLKSDLEKIESSNRFLLSLINDVLDISRVDSGKIELMPEPYPSDELLLQINNILEPLCSEKGLKHEIVRNDRGSGVIVADKVRLNQIILNIISNAVRYTPKGGTVRYTSINEDLSGGKVRFGFTVEDTGIGMSQEFQKRMFNDFSQEYNNPNRPKGITGTGLGLSIVKKMVDLMDGEISVRSELGRGTAITVRIIFPDASKDPSYNGPRVKKSMELEDNSPLHGKILIVEDNAINMEIATRILERFGLTIVAATNGEEGVKVFLDSSPGELKAIFMDIQMPVMDGYSATKTIRAMDRGDAKTIPIIAMTADAFSEAVQKAWDAGMTEYVTKPLRAERMRSLLIHLAPDTVEAV